MMKNFIKSCLNLKSTSKSRTIRELILRETAVESNSLTPEIKLRLITENCRLFHSTADELEALPFEELPYWGFYWPGGMAVSRYILDHPEVVKHKKVLDFGSGCGATSVACAIKQCRQVVANDTDKYAAVAALINSELNNVQIETDTRNLISSPCSFNFDVIVFGDVFYDEEFAAQLLPWITKLVENGQTCLIGDPGRHALSKSLQLELLAQYKLPENVCIENNGFRFTNVFKVK